MNLDWVAFFKLILLSLFLCIPVIYVAFIAQPAWATESSFWGGIQISGYATPALCLIGAISALFHRDGEK